jgi:murein DD-endopeptidase MepM/ murein hydrolase activator NlpD
MAIPQYVLPQPFRFKRPVPTGFPITCRYGQIRNVGSAWHIDPQTGLWVHGTLPDGTVQHKGTDFGVPEGTAVTAPCNGLIIRAGWENPDDHKQGFGLRIRLLIMEPGYDSWELVLAHLSLIYKWSGEKVQTGDRLALSGNTGNTTGPHLHTEFLDLKKQYRDVPFEA